MNRRTLHILTLGTIIALSGCAQNNDDRDRDHDQPVGGGGVHPSFHGGFNENENGEGGSGRGTRGGFGGEGGHGGFGGEAG